MMSIDKIMIKNSGIFNSAMVKNCNGATSMTKGNNRLAENTKETNKLMSTMKNIGRVLESNVCRLNTNRSSKLNTMTLIIGTR
jgi:hypothetical protein